MFSPASMHKGECTDRVVSFDLVKLDADSCGPDTEGLNDGVGRANREEGLLLVGPAPKALDGDGGQGVGLS
jgi:hypothetical protein